MSDAKGLRSGPSAGAECPICDEPMVIYNPGHRAYDKEIAPVVADAVEHANRHPANSNLEADGDIIAGVTDGYYPDDIQHWIDLSEIDPDLRHSATITANTELNRRGLMFNSVRFDAPKLHVVPASHLVERLPGKHGVEQ